MQVLLSMFCLGAFSMIVQVVFTREMLVQFFGNELSIGVMFGCWLGWIGVGAAAARPLLKRVTGVSTPRTLLLAGMTALAAFLPLQLTVIRVARSFFGVPFAEHASLGTILAAAALVFLPTCFAIGFLFPFACRAMPPANGHIDEASYASLRVNRVYLWESAGGMIGGALVTFVLMPWLSPVRITAAGCGIVLAGAALLPARRIARCAMGALAGVLIAAALCPSCLRPAEVFLTEARWKSFGVLREGTQSRLAGTADSVYQNLAVIETEGQYSLYGDGQVMFSFPQQMGEGEMRIHFIMAQKPDAKRVLLIGGNPVVDIPELFKYRVDSLVYVEADPEVGRLIGPFTNGEYDRLMADPRVNHVPVDGIRYVRTCAEQFDVILVSASQPSTAAANRFYTLEFYRAARRILEPSGFLHTGITVSEDLQSATVRLGSSVYRTLRAEFPVVLATAGDRVHFFAGGTGSNLTFDREELRKRSAGANLVTAYYRPEYFIGADEIDPDKTAMTVSRFEQATAPVNTVGAPIACFYNTIMWSRISSAGVEPLLNRLASIRWGEIPAYAIAAGIICLLAGIALRRRGPNRWSRAMAATVIATTGFCAMALEIVLIFLFQNLYGYIYARIGMVAAMFMLGLVAGAAVGTHVTGLPFRRTVLSVMCVELLLMLFCAAVPAFAERAYRAGMPGSAGWLFEPGIYAAVAFAGWATGVEFQLCNRLYCEAKGSVGGSAAITDSADHFGAAAGALVVGVVLLPVVGLADSCLALAAIKAAGLLCATSALIAAAPAGSRRHG